MSTRNGAANDGVDIRPILESMNASRTRRARWRFRSRKYQNWSAYTVDAPELIIIIDDGPHDPRQLEEAMAGMEAAAVCVAGGVAALLLSDGKHVVTIPVRTAAEADAICGKLSGCGFGESPGAIPRAMDAVPAPRLGFSNRGVFPTGHMLNHILMRTGRTAPAMTPWRTLHRLGWKVDADREGNGTTHHATAAGDVCVMVRGEGGALPEFEAWSVLRRYGWVILVRGTAWSLYRSGAPALGSFTIDTADELGALYLEGVFGASSYDSGLLERLADGIGDGSAESRFVRSILCGGTFGALAEGLISADAPNSASGLRRIKDAAVTILCQIWFVTQAEERGILPLQNAQYRSISLLSMQDRICHYESEPHSTSCWKDICRLVRVVRDGDVRCGVPGHDTALFHSEMCGPVENRYLTGLLRLFSPKYGMRHDVDISAMGSIYEALTGASLEQMPGGAVAVQTKHVSPTRKRQGAYYTPRTLVRYLAQGGLEPILEERKRSVALAVSAYREEPGPTTAKACIDHTLDIRVLDPTAGSGRFLIEALDIISGWATELLADHPDHPILRELVPEAAPPAMYGAHLRRLIVERCIFGVDLDPLAAEITRISLWLASWSAEPPGNRHIRVGDATMGMWHSDIVGRQTESLDFSAQSRQGGSPAEQRRALNILMANIMEDTSIPKKRARSPPRTRIPPGQAEAIAEKYRFFHWELEMPEAFDGRRGFDAILGNPPWEQVRVEPVELYKTDGMDASLGRRKSQGALRAIAETDYSRQMVAESRADLTRRMRFYRTQHSLSQGIVNMYWLVLNRMLALMAEGGTVSVVVPAQLCNSRKNAPIRRKLFDMKIRHIYVFTNSQSVFPIDRRFRFMLLSAQNSPGPDTFPAGFYLSRPESLYDHALEPDRFTTLSKRFIRETSPTALNIPELGDNTLWDIHAKMHRNGMRLETGRNGWTIRRYVHMRQGGPMAYGPPPYPAGYQPVVEGKNIRHYEYNHTPIEKALDMRGFRSSPNTSDYMLVGRAVTGATNIRTVITAVVPPGYLANTTLFRLDVYTPKMHAGGGHGAGDRIHEMLCLEGILNSLPFDFVAKTLVNNHLEGVILALPVPPPSPHDLPIARRAAMLTVDGSADFDALAAHMKIRNECISGEARIRLAAEIEAMVARGYGLDAGEYRKLADSFYLELQGGQRSPDPEMTNELKSFGRAVRDQAIRYIQEERQF